MGGTAGGEAFGKRTPAGLGAAGPEGAEAAAAGGPGASPGVVAPRSPLRMPREAAEGGGG